MNHTASSRVKGPEPSSLSYQFPDIVDAFSHQTAHNLERAVVICRAVGAERPQYLALMALILEIFDDAVSTKRLNALLWFGRLEVMFGVSGDTSRIAAVIEEAAGWRDAAAHRTQIVELWRLAARLYAKIGRKDEAGRCLNEAAERLAEEAEELAPSSALGASHIMAQAIAQLAGVTGRRERRRQLQHRLVDFQANIANEMTSFSQDIDLSEMVDGLHIQLQRCRACRQSPELCSSGATPNPRTAHQVSARACHRESDIEPVLNISSRP